MIYCFFEVVTNRKVYKTYKIFESMENKIINISEKYLKSVFRDKKFINKLKNLKEFEHLEGQFFVYSDLESGNYEITDIEVGDTDSVGGEFSELRDIDYLGNFNRIMSVHTHATIPAIFPSPADLEASYGSELTTRLNSGIDVREINGIMRYSEYPVPILLFQRRKDFPLDLVGRVSDNSFESFDDMKNYDFFEECFDELFLDFTQGRTDNQSEVVNRLRESKLYNAELVYLEKNGFSKESLEKIANFAYETKKGKAEFD
jgi:hypothetical protein|tara:strand:+ start:1385 stop:2164 length:780 start_codon:yes stop_codon:yes gene_type:complete